MHLISEALRHAIERREAPAVLFCLGTASRLVLAVTRDWSLARGFLSLIAPARLYDWLWLLGLECISHLGREGI